jgi:thioredoxin-like negative regulator of GroEL
MVRLIAIVFLTALTAMGIQAHISGYFKQDVQEELKDVEGMIKAEHWADAQARLDRLIKEHPYNPEAYNHLATVEVNLGHLERAKSLLMMARTIQWSPRVQRAEFENWYVVRDVVFIILGCEILYTGIFYLVQRKKQTH